MTETTIQEAKQQLHKVIRQNSPFEQKARDILELGCRCLEADHGYLAQVDQVTNHWETTITTETTDSQTTLAVSRDLRETYCRETIDDDSPFALHDAPDQGWTDDPAFEISDFDAYLGVPLILDDGLYGTVCFVAEDPQSDPFSEKETWFTEHLTRLLERELERDQVEAQLTSQTNLATVLNRVLRHNLRNDMSVIRAYTELMADQFDDEDTAETILTHIDSLINLSDKARELEQIISASSKRRQTEIGPLVEDIVEPIARNYPTATISVEYDDEIHTGVLQNFDRALEELIENALKHSGDRPTVTIDIEAVPNAVEIRIQDDGPGLPDQESEVLTEGEESPLIHGSGLGLWLAYWIISSHDGSVDPVTTENGTTMVVSIPQTSAIGSQQKLTEVKRTRDKYRKAFQEGNNPKLILNDEARIIDANPEAGKLYGLDPQTLLGQPIQQLIPDDVDFDTEWREFQSGKRKRGTVTVVAASGAERQVEYSATKDIVPGQHLVVGQDITERKQREQELEFTKDLLDKTERIADVGGWEIDVETNEVFWTEHLFELLGMESDEALLLDEAMDVYIEEDRPRVEQAIEEALSAAQRFNVKARFRRPDGEIRWLDIHGHPTVEDDEVVTLRGAVQDITDWKRREQKITALKDRYESLLEAAPDPVFVADTETGELIEVNRAAETLIGESRDQLVGRHQTTLHPAADAELYREVFEQIAGERTTVRTLPDGSYPELVAADDETIPVEISVDTVSLPDQTVTYGIFRDISERVEHEQALKETNRRLETLIETAEAAIFMKDAKGRYQLINDHCAELMGLDDPAEGTGHMDGDLFPEDVAAQYQADDQAIMESGESRVIEEEIPTEDGTRTYRTHKSPVWDADGRIQGVCAVSTDITWRTNMERELAEEKAFIDNVLNSLSDIFYVFDLNNTLVEYNDRLSKVTGYDNEIAEIKLWNFFQEEEQAKIEEEIARVTDDEEHVEFDSEIVTKQGETIPYEFSAAPYYDNDGNVAGVVGTGRDISERIERERELRAKKRAMDKASVGIALTDPNKVDNPMVYVNEQFSELTGYNEDEIIGQNCRFLQGEETDPETVAEIRQAIDAKESVTTVIRNYRKDGTPFWNRLTIAPVTDEEGELMNWVGFQEDVTYLIEGKTDIKEIDKL